MIWGSCESCGKSAGTNFECHRCRQIDADLHYLTGLRHVEPVKRVSQAPASRREDGREQANGAA